MIYDHVSGSLSTLDAEIVRVVPEGGNWRNLPENINSSRVRQIRESAARGEGSRSTYYGRLRWDRPSYTVSTYFNRPGNGCFIHPSINRLITIREAARLQSFPDSYRFYGKGRARYLQVGNAVPPLLAYQLGRVLTCGTVVDLFSGAGGLSLGLEWAGFKLLAAVDHNAAASKTLQENRPQKSLAIDADLSDSSELQKAVDEIRHRAGGSRIELVAGGAPCQGFSTAGNCRLDDSRNKLVYAFVKAVADLKPIQVLMENVAALTFRRGRQVLEELRKSLHSLGYRTSFIVAHAEGYGVPQLRRRFFLLAVKGSTPSWPKPFREVVKPMMSKYQPWAQNINDLEKPVTVQEAIGDLPPEAAESLEEPVEYRVRANSEYQRWIRGEVGLEAVCPESVSAYDSSPLSFESASAE